MPEPTAESAVITAGVYEHYKGPRYLVLGLAHDSNHDGRVAVIYVPLYDAPGPRLAVRDLADFTAEVDGRPRFRLVAAQPPEPDPEWTNDQGRNPGCLHVSCGERQDGRHGKWWDDYGTCSRSHAEDYYGEECIE